MASRGPLVVVGSVNADLVFQINRLPQQGETIGARQLETFAGGKGANQAAAAAKLAYPTYILGQVGTDANADMLRESLQTCGVNVSHLRAVEGPTGTAVILLEPSGENSIISVGGANTADWEIPASARQLLRSAGAVLLQREIPEQINIAAAQVARSGDVAVILDCGGVEGPISPELLHLVTILSPNETELSRLTGMPADTAEDAIAAARRLQQEGVEVVLVKRGKQGSILVPTGGKECICQPAVTVSNVVDTTGAGDCFTAAFAVASMEGQAPADALRFAAAAAALCVQRKGAMPSMPERGEVLALLQQR